MPQLLVPPASGCSARLSRNDRATVTVTPCSESDGGLGPGPAGTVTAALEPILVSGSSSCCAAGSAILSGGVSASHEYRRPRPQTSGPGGRRRRSHAAGDSGVPRSPVRRRFNTTHGHWRGITVRLTERASESFAAVIIVTCIAVMMMVWQATWTRIGRLGNTNHH